jgi:hypothetical protein
MTGMGRRQAGELAIAGDEQTIREALSALERLAQDYGIPVGPSTVTASFDERGVVTALAAVGDGPVELETLRTDILRALAGRVPPGLSRSPHLLEAWLDGLDARRPATFTNDLRSVTVSADLGAITGVALDPTLLRGGRPQTICDEVLPVARRAQLGSDRLGLFGGTR